MAAHWCSTIYKMIEKLDKSDCEVKFFFSDYSNNGRTNFSENFNKNIYQRIKIRD